MDRRTFLLAGAGAVVLAACGTKSAADDPELGASSSTDASPTTAGRTAPTTAAVAPTAAPAAVAPTTAAPGAAPANAPQPTAAEANNDNPGITSPPNAHAPEPVNQIGAIAVPKLGLSTALFEGVTLTTLNRVGVGHWPGTALPSQSGNVVVAGHRVTHSRPFRNIDTLGPGDQVIFTIGNGQHTYTFAGNEIVPPNAMRIVNQSADKTATLFACHPPGSARFRFVVHLTYVGSTSV
jgi:sortase A